MAQNHNQFIRCLDNIQDLSGQKHFEYAILLTGGAAFSRKTISYNKKKDEYYVENHIDNTIQKLSAEQMMDPNYTNIGDAMKKRSLIALID